LNPAVHPGITILVDEIEIGREIFFLREGQFFFEICKSSFSFFDDIEKKRERGFF